MRVEQSLLAESWNPAYAALGFDPDDRDPPFLKPAVEGLAEADLRANSMKWVTSEKIDLDGRMIDYRLVRSNTARKLRYVLDQWSRGYTTH